MEPITIDFGSLSKPVLLALAITAICRAVKAIPSIKDWLIPWTAIICGAALYPLLEETWCTNNVVVGVIIGGMTVGFYATAKQTFVNRSEESGADPSPAVKAVFGIKGRPNGKPE